MSITVTFPDGNSRCYENSVSIFDVADSISHKLAKNALAGEVDGKVMVSARRCLFSLRSRKGIHTKFNSEVYFCNTSIIKRVSRSTG